MTALISVWKGTSCLGTCDAKCYNATNERCTCVCLGLNHGKHLEGAKFQTENHFRLLTLQWERDDPDAVVLRAHGEPPVPALNSDPQHKNAAQ